MIIILKIYSLLWCFFPHYRANKYMWLGVDYQWVKKKPWTVLLSCGLEWLSRCLFRCLFRHTVQLGNRTLWCGMASWLAAVKPCVIGQIQPLTRPGSGTHTAERGLVERPWCRERERELTGSGCFPKVMKYLRDVWGLGNETRMW